MYNFPPRPNIGEIYVKVAWFESINGGTSGTLTPPVNGEIVLDQWAAGVDALASQISGGLPNYVSPRTSANVVITATLDSAGNWTLSGTPASYPVAIIYVYRIKVKFFDYTKSLEIIELEPWADTVYVDASVFSKNLSALDTTVQHSLETLDQLASGDFSGPAGAVDSNLVEFDTTTGKKVKDGSLTHADVASAVSLKHAAVTVSAPIVLTGQAIELKNNAVSPAQVTAIDVGALANTDTVIPTSKAVTTAIAAGGGITVQQAIMYGLIGG